jgi:hypothetical protein
MELYRIKDPDYIEGFSLGQILAKKINVSEYETLEKGIAIKEKLLEMFEKNFGWTEEKPHPTYMKELGILDALKKENND